MKFLRFEVFLLGLLVAPAAVAQSNLPQCPSDTKVPWNNCQGTVTFNDGGKYVGEFSNGKMSGQGTFTWADGDKYVGGFSDNKPNGKGTMFAPDGTIKKSEDSRRVATSDSGTGNPSHDFVSHLSPAERAALLGKDIPCTGAYTFFNGIGVEKKAYWSMRCTDGQSYMFEIAPNAAESKVVECSLMNALPNVVQCFKKFRGQ